MITQLPDRCPTCNKALVSVYLSLQPVGTESGDYACGLQLYKYRDSSSKPVTRKRCAADPSEVAAQARRDAVDNAVAGALRRVKATHEECREFASRMQTESWSESPKGIWLQLPRR